MAAVSPLPENAVEEIEFVEYATARPQEFGAALEAMGFRAVARHRSREVLLYRQGDIKVIVNSDARTVRAEHLHESDVVLKALALRVPDAGRAHARALECGARNHPGRSGPMELNIPGVQGPGGAMLFLLDRRAGVSFDQIDFIALAGVAPDVPAQAGLHFFGVVQYLREGDSAGWARFYHEVFGFAALPPGTAFGVLPTGTILKSACGRFFLQLIEQPPGAEDADWIEGFNRVGLGVPDVPRAVALLEARGIRFVDSAMLGDPSQGALTRTLVGDTQFELVHHVA